MTELDATLRTKQQANKTPQRILGEQQSLLGKVYIRMVKQKAGYLTFKKLSKKKRALQCP